MEPVKSAYAVRGLCVRDRKPKKKQEPETEYTPRKQKPRSFVTKNRPKLFICFADPPPEFLLSSSSRTSPLVMVALIGNTTNMRDRSCLTQEVFVYRDGDDDGATEAEIESLGQYIAARITVASTP
jgi:hypothetical protein